MTDDNLTQGEWPDLDENTASGLTTAEQAEIEQEPPTLNIIVVECAICHEQLVNTVTRWIHEPGTVEDHVPVPQPRTSQPVIPPV